MPSRIRVYAWRGLWCLTWTEYRYRVTVRCWEWHRRQADAWDRAGELRGQ